MKNISVKKLIFVISALLMMIHILSAQTQITPISNLLPNSFESKTDYLIPNSSAFSMNQSVSFTSSFGNGRSLSTGMFSNFMNYQPNDNLNINVGVHLLAPYKTQNNFSTDDNMNIFYDLNLEYKFSDNFHFVINYKNFPKYSSNQFYNLGY
jgi:hypothetical protein